MEETGADYTNTFRWLSMVDIPVPADIPAGNGSTLHNEEEPAVRCSIEANPAYKAFLDRIVASLPGPEILAEAITPPNSIEVSIPCTSSTRHVTLLHVAMTSL